MYIVYMRKYFDREKKIALEFVANLNIFSPSEYEKLSMYVCMYECAPC
jgi:hypothetical protein